MAVPLTYWGTWSVIEPPCLTALPRVLWGMDGTGDRKGLLVQGGSSRNLKVLFHPIFSADSSRLGGWVLLSPAMQ